MWRTRAVISLLVEDIAGLEMVPADADRPESASLDRAIRRARVVIGIDCLALVILFLTHNPVRPFLRWEPAVETIFTLGVLAVAVHAGFRWAELQRYRSVKRVCEDLRDRIED